MPALDYQDIIEAKGLPCYDDLLRHKQDNPRSSLDRIWLEATGIETLDHFLTHSRPLPEVSDVAPEPANPVQEVQGKRSLSSNQATTSPGIFSMLPRRMSLLAANGICVEPATIMPTTTWQQGSSEARQMSLLAAHGIYVQPATIVQGSSEARRMSLLAAHGIYVQPATIVQGSSEDGMHVASTEPVIHIARGLSVKDEDNEDDATPPSPHPWLYASRIHHHEMFCCCLLCMAMNT